MGYDISLLLPNLLQPKCATTTSRNAQRTSNNINGVDPPLDHEDPAPPTFSCVLMHSNDADQAGTRLLHGTGPFPARSPPRCSRHHTQLEWDQWLYLFPNSVKCARELRGEERVYSQGSFYCPLRNSCSTLQPATNMSPEDTEATDGTLATQKPCALLTSTSSL